MNMNANNNMTNELEHIGVVLKKNRIRCDLSIATVCEKTNINQYRLMSFEKGTSFPNLTQLQRLAEVYHTNILALFLETNEKSTEPKPEKKTNTKTCHYLSPQYGYSRKQINKNSNDTIKHDHDRCPYQNLGYIQCPAIIKKLDIGHIPPCLVFMQPCTNNPDNKTCLGSCQP